MPHLHWHRRGTQCTIRRYYHGGQSSFSFEEVHQFLGGAFDGELHAKRVPSLTNATLDVIINASLAVSTIEQELVLARGLSIEHAIKQVDRLLSNQGIDADAALRHWVRYVVAARTSINIALDWTDFDVDGQATIMLSLLSSHGRATPLMWLSVDTSTLKNRRNEYEYQVLVRPAEAPPADIKVCVVADRGFGDHKLYGVLAEEFHFNYIIRFRGNIKVTSAEGETRTAANWVKPGGLTRVLRGATVTVERYQVGAVACVRDKEMKQAWCLAISIDAEGAETAIKLYSRRWGIESGFRDTKDLRYGMGMGIIHVGTPARRDRLVLLNAFAVALLTLLAAAVQALGYDRMPKSNTTKRMTRPPFHQGCMLYELIPTMPEARLRPLIECFAALLAEQPVFAHVFGPL